MAVLSSDLIRQGAAGASTGYTIENSCRFNNNDTAGLTKTFGTASNAKKWTIAAWVKLIAKTDEASSGVRLLDAGAAAGSEDLVTIGSGYAGYENLYLNKRTSSSYNIRLQTRRFFKDPSAWYHVVVNYDSDNTAAGERARFYINGEREFDLSQATYPSSSLASRINTNIAHGVMLSVNTSGTVQKGDGYLADYYFLDGYSYDPSYFGEFDENGIWIPKEYSGSYGNNGFFFEFKNSGSLGADTSGNGNNFASTGLASNDQRTDTPTNNMITFNPLNNQRSGGNPQNGNLQYDGPGTRTIISLTANIPPTGKWAVAFSAAAVSTNAGWNFGITKATNTNFGDAAGSNEDVGGQDNDGLHMSPSSSDLQLYDYTTSTSIDPSLPITTSDEFWLAVDMATGKCFLGIYDESATTMKFVAADTGLDGNPATGDNPTTTISDMIGSNEYTFAVGSKDTSNDVTLLRSTEVSGTTPTGYTYFENVKDLI